MSYNLSRHSVAKVLDRLTQIARQQGGTVVYASLNPTKDGYDLRQGLRALDYHLHEYPFLEVVQRAAYKVMTTPTSVVCVPRTAMHSMDGGEAINDLSTIAFVIAHPAVQQFSFANSLKDEAIERLQRWGAKYGWTIISSRERIIISKRPDSSASTVPSNGSGGST
jgi:hypothetical protein